MIEIAYVEVKNVKEKLWPCPKLAAKRKIAIVLVYLELRVLCLPITGIQA